MNPPSLKRAIDPRNPPIPTHKSCFIKNSYRLVGVISWRAVSPLLLREANSIARQKIVPIWLESTHTPESGAGQENREPRAAAAVGAVDLKTSPVDAG